MRKVRSNCRPGCSKDEKIQGAGVAVLKGATVMVGGIRF